MLLVAAAALVSTGLLFWAVRDPIFAGTFLAGLIGVGGLLLLLRRAEPSGLAAPHEDAPYDAALLRAVLDGAGPTSALALTDPAGELISANSAWGRWFGAGVGPLHARALAAGQHDCFHAMPRGFTPSMKRLSKSSPLETLALWKCGNPGWGFPPA